MENSDKGISRFSAIGWILLLYFVPVIALTFFSGWGSNPWSIWTVGLLLVAMGTYLFDGLMFSYEASLREQVPKPIPVEIPIAPPPRQEEALADNSALEELQQKLEEAVELQGDYQRQLELNEHQLSEIRQERDFVQLKMESAVAELEHVREESQQQIDRERRLLQEHQLTIQEQRETLERKQHQIQQFEGKIRDLNYEIKTLLQLAERGSEEIKETKKFSTDMTPQWDEIEVRTPEEALIELKRCIDMAQRMAAISPFGGQSRFKELSQENSALDLRRLFDRLKELKTSGLFVYDLKEQKILFVNDHLEKLLGIANEKFIQLSQQLFESPSWKQVIQQLQFKSEAKIDLSLPTEQGDIPLQGLLGAIPTGLFKSHAIGVLYPAAVVTDATQGRGF